MPTMVLTTTCQYGSESISVAETITNELIGVADFVIPIGATDRELSVAFDKDLGKLFFMVSDVALTVKTNSSGSPVDTIALAANQPVVIRAGQWPATTFTADVTKLFVTNGTGVTGNLRIRSLADASP